MNQIRSERARLGLSQDDLAEKLGVSRQSIINWEQGDVDLKASVVVAMAELFSCSTDYLLGCTNERLPKVATK